MNFHVASRGSPLTLTSQQGGFLFKLPLNFTIFFIFASVKVTLFFFFCFFFGIIATMSEKGQRSGIDTIKHHT